MTATEVGDVAGLAVDGAFVVLRELADRLGGGPFERVTLAVPGLCDGGRVVSLPGKFRGIEGRDLAAELADLSSSGEVVVCNDAIAYGIGEALHGAGRGAHRVAVVTIGTGVGCAVIEDGRPLGSGPLGGGLLGGQLPVSAPEGPTDTSGNRGTFEARCCADRIVAEAQAAGADVSTVPEVYAAHAAGDRAAAAGLDAYRAWLALGLAAIVTAYTPDVVVVGGGPLAPEAPLLDGVEAAVRERIWPGLFPEIRRSVLGDRAALLGVATFRG